jgi:ankyrin repeat protein
MDLFIIKGRLKLSLWLVGVGFAGCLLAAWYAKWQTRMGGEEERFLLFATVTGALALSWLVLLTLYLFTRRMMDPRHNWPDRLSNIPWVIKILALCILIAVMGVVLQKYSGRAKNEFSLLREGNLGRLEKRIAAKPYLLESKNKKAGKTLLELALETGNAEAVDMLLSRGAELASATDSFTLMALLDNPPMLGAFLRHGMSPDASDTDGMPLLHYAVETQNTNALAVLLNAGADVNVRDPLYQTPLLQAIMVDNIPIAGVLIEHGANPNQWDKRGDTALHKAVRRRSIESVRFLLENGADPKTFNFINMAPIHIAAFNGQNELVELFLEQPDLLNLMNEDDHTAFDHALRGRHYETARLLAEHGADIDRVMANGYTAIHLMIIAKDYESVKFLIEEGADMHIASSDGETAYDLMNKKKLQSLLYLVELRDNPPEIGGTNTVDSAVSP